MVDTWVLGRRVAVGLGQVWGRGRSVAVFPSQKAQKLSRVLNSEKLMSTEKKAKLTSRLLSSSPATFIYHPLLFLQVLIPSCPRLLQSGTYFLELLQASTSLNVGTNELDHQMTYVSGLETCLMVGTRGISNHA